MRHHRRISASTIDQRPAWQRDVRFLASSRGISMAGAEAGSQRAPVTLVATRSHTALAYRALAAHIGVDLGLDVVAPAEVNTACLTLESLRSPLVEREGEREADDIAGYATHVEAAGHGA